MRACECSGINPAQSFPCSQSFLSIICETFFEPEKAFANGN
jgi:hypothetical protein